MTYPEAQATRVKAHGTTPNQQPPPPNFWDLASYNHEEPTKDCRRRAECGISEREFYPDLGVFIPAEQYNTAKIHALISGTPGKPYEDYISAQNSAHNHQFPSPSVWYLVRSEHAGATDECRFRVGCSSTETRFYCVPTLSICAQENNAAKITGFILRPPETPCAGGDRPRINSPFSSFPLGTSGSSPCTSTNKPPTIAGAGSGAASRRCRFSRISGVIIPSEENNTTESDAINLGPPHKPYEGGSFNFLIKCPPYYPDCSPRVRLMTTATGHIRFGPRFYHNDKLYIGCLGSLYESTWSTDQCPLNLMIIKFQKTAKKPFPKESAFDVLPIWGTWLSDKICYTVLRHETHGRGV